MTGGEAYELVMSARTWLAPRISVNDIDFEDDAPIGDGATHIEGNDLFVHIGVAEFVDDPDREFRDGEALLPFVALFHEVAGHSMQFTHEFNKTNTLSKVLFLSECACKGSAQYYGVDDNGVPHDMYFSHPHEIAAQYMGIKCGYAYLSKRYPDDADRMMLDYIDYRCEHGCEFLPGDVKFDTVEDALDAMNKEFQRCVERHREFYPVHDSHDALGMLADRNKDRPILDIVKNCENGLRQDGMMACAFLAMMDSRRSMESGFLKSTRVHLDLNLDINKMFNGKGSPIWPPPIRSLTNLARLHAITSHMDRDDRSEEPDYC